MNLMMIYLTYINCCIVLFSLISVNFIPNKKYYEKNHFIDILKIKFINFVDTNYNISIISDVNTISNYTFILSEVEHKINSCKIINIIISVFSSILLSLAFWSFFKDFIKLSRKTNIFYNSCLSLLSLFIFILALVILIKINKITKVYDYENIGLTLEIKSRIIIIIIMMSFNIVIIFLNFFMLQKKDKIMTIINEAFEIEEENERLKEKSKTFKANEKIKEENKILKENERLKEENEELKESKRLKEENKKLKENNENLKAENKKLKENKRLIEENEKLKEESKKLKEEKEKLKDENEKLKEENKELKEEYIKFKELTINNKSKEEIKNKELKQENNRKEIAIIFISGEQNMNYPMICQNNEKFAIYEQKLYDNFPQYKESENYFICNGKKINRNYTIEENKIKYGDIIQINIVE